MKAMGETADRTSAKRQNLPSDVAWWQKNGAGPRTGTRAAVNQIKAPQQDRLTRC
jgi:hypothetical protein